MSKNEGVRGLLITAVIFSFAAFPARMQAETVYAYDLDSLVHVSTDVAEVEITRRYKARELDLIDVKVTLVHKGGFKKEQSVVVLGADSYRGFEQAAGTRLVLFLEPLKEVHGAVIPKDAVIYYPLQGGMRLIKGDKVFGFTTVWSLGYTVRGDKSATLERFREKVKGSLRDTQEWASLVKAKKDNLDVPRLLKLLASRPEPADSTDGNLDYFAEQICMRFAEAQDPDLLSRALAVSKNHQGASILRRGFGTPKGREYLLGKVADAKEPMPARLRYADTLYEAGYVYRETITDITASSSRSLGKADESNSAYLTRIAKLARANAKDEKLCLRLVRCLGLFGGAIVQSKPAPLMEDLRGAFAVLKEIYDTHPSQELQFAIESATSRDREAYEKLKSPCGDFISILRAVDQTKYTKPKKRSLIFEYEFAAGLLSAEASVQALKVVLVHQGTQKRTLIPMQLQIQGAVAGGGVVELPKDLPAGRYHVFFQLGDGDKVISSGHYLIADL